MTAIYFPGIEEFYTRFCLALKQSGQEQRFLTKWGLETLSDAYDILNNNVQGGFESHKQTMLAGKTGGSIMNIGPGMGFCVFLLSELFDNVYVAEPDGENCDLLEHIAVYYQTGKNQKASAVVKIIHAGLSITDEAVKYWHNKAQLMKKRNLKGSILNFDIKDAAELNAIFHEKVSRVYFHKVLSSLSIANRFENVIDQCSRFLEAGGEITWSEPGYIFDDLLNAGGQLENIITPICAKNNLQANLLNYEVSNRAENNNTVLVENWTLIKAVKG